MRAWVKLTVASCFSVVALNSTTVARANEICEALKAELAQTPTIITNARDMGLYAGAVTRQNFEIRKTLQNMQRVGCSSSVSVLDASGHDICQDMQASLAAMQANKQKLAKQRQAANKQGDVNPRRQDLLAALQTNACDVQQTELPESSDRRRPFEAPVYPEYMGQTNTPTGILRGQFLPPSGQGGYRTLCVRSCDGAFFPISPSTPPANFGRDAAQCQRMCPGTETELYYSKLSEEAEDMVSTVTGKPYRDTPSAFAYRTRAPGQSAQCGCGKMSTPPIQPGAAISDASSVITINTNPPSKAEEIQAPALSEQKQDKNEKPARVFDSSNTSIRQVGPAFFPSTTKNIDLKHPALEGPQPVQ